MRPSAQPFLWKWVLFAWGWKIICIWKAEPRFGTEAGGNLEMAYYQQTSAQKWTVRGCCHFTLGAELSFNNSWFVGFFSCGWGFQKRNPWHPCPVRPFPACGRPTPLRGQEIWWTWCPISLPEVLPLNFPFALSWSSIKCINLMDLYL